MGPLCLCNNAQNGEARGIDLKSAKIGFRQDAQLPCKFHLTSKMKRKPKQSLEFVKKIPKETYESSAYGCLLGVFVGDSIGSYLEFLNVPATTE